MRSPQRRRLLRNQTHNQGLHPAKAGLVRRIPRNGTLHQKEKQVDKISYSINEAVSASGLGRTTLYELIKAGQLSPVKIGARTLILRSDLEGMLERAKAA